MGKKRRVRGSYPQFAKVILFLCVMLILLIVYLIGKVNMDVVLIKNDELVEARDSLNEKIDELNVIINKKSGYKRIVSLARKQGLIFVPPSRICELKVYVDSTFKDLREAQKVVSKLARSE